MRTLHRFVACWTLATGLFCVCLRSAYERKVDRVRREPREPVPATVVSENGRVRVVMPNGDAGKEAKEVVALVLELRLYAEDGTYKVASETEFLNAQARDTRPGKEAAGDVVAGTWR